MKKYVNNEHLMIKACQLYYDDDMRQEDIARQLGLSRPTISRLLKDAKSNGIVKIKIVNPNAKDYSQLERSI